jgi:hypothetical protein
MSNTLALSYVTTLPEYTPHAKFLQLQIENWQLQYAQAGAQKEQAWQLYGEAIDEEMHPDEIEQRFIMAQLFDDIAREAWGEWQKAKAELLLLLN